MDLNDVQAERAVTCQLGRFARILDDKRWDDLGHVFANDVTFNYGEGGEQAGLDALRRTVSYFLDGCGPTQHLIGSVIVTIEPGSGDRATSQAYVQARHQRSGDPAGPVFDSCGDYVDAWTLRDGRWLIVRREVNWLLHSGDPAILSLSAGQVSRARPNA